MFQSDKTSDTRKQSITIHVTRSSVLMSRVSDYNSATRGRISHLGFEISKGRGGGSILLRGRGLDGEIEYESGAFAEALAVYT
jgi:hypothetical protein